MTMRVQRAAERLLEAWEDTTVPEVATDLVQADKRIAYALSDLKDELGSGTDTYDGERDEDSWRDYDHGFRDGYQAARRELTWAWKCR